MRKKLLSLTLIAILLILAIPSAAQASEAEEVYVVKVMDTDYMAIIERSNGDQYLIEYGIGVLSIWRYEGKKALIYFPSLFAGIGSKIILPDQDQSARIWSSELINTGYAPAPVELPSDSNSPSQPAPTSTQSNTYPTVYVNGRQIYFDTPLTIIDDSVMVPMRSIFEALGAVVEWQPDTNAILAQTYTKTMYIYPGSDKGIVNDVSVLVHPAPRITSDNRTIVPLRFISESLGANVTWDSTAFAIYITTESSSEPLSPTAEDDTPIPPYEWTYNGDKWSWAPDVPQRTVDTILDYYRELPHPHRNQLDYVLTYCTDKDSLEIIDSVAQVITQGANNEGLSKEEIPYLAIAFVQSFPYVSDSISSGYDEYPRYPFETLLERKGDCEDTAILTAVLLRQLGYGSALIFLPNHCAVGVLGKDEIEGTYYLVNGQRYYYLETTDVGWEVGVVPDSIKDTNAVVLPLP